MTCSYGSLHIFLYTLYTEYNMCSLVVSVLDYPAVDPRSNLDSGSALSMSENLRLYTTSPVVIC